MADLAEPPPWIAPQNKTSSQFSSQLDSMLGRSLISLLCDLARVSVKFDILDATCVKV
jgi:hypothetical protein